MHACTHIHIPMYRHRWMHSLIHTTHTPQSHGHTYTTLHTYIHASSSATGPPGSVCDSNRAELIGWQDITRDSRVSHLPSPGIEVSAVTETSRIYLSWLQGDHGYMDIWKGVGSMLLLCLCTYVCMKMRTYGFMYSSTPAWNTYIVNP